MSDSIHKLTKNILYKMRRSVFELKRIKDLITNIRTKQDNNDDLTESDYNLIMTAILPHYFPYNIGWIIGAEIWNIDPTVKHGRADHVVLWIEDGNSGFNRNIGDILPYVVYEGKKHKAYTWENLLADQLFAECEGLIIDGKRIWAIGQIGLEMCVFRFDLDNYKVPGKDFSYEHFSPLNINNWTPAQLDARQIKHITKSYGHNTYITHVIRWELDNPMHQIIIHDMLQYIASHNV